MRAGSPSPAATPSSGCRGRAALDERLSAKDAVARCGLQIVDIDTGNAVEWLRYEHTIEELYDVAVMSGVRQAEAVGFRADDIQREIIPG